MCVYIYMCVCVFDPLQGRAALMSIVAVPAGFFRGQAPLPYLDNNSLHRQTHTHTNRQRNILA